MIFIIGTAHSLQYWSDAIRAGEDMDSDSARVLQFEQYLHDTACLVGATAIAEELSQQLVEERQGGESVARNIANRLKLSHLFCDPDRGERGMFAISDVQQREAFWADRLAQLFPNNTSVIFVCGASHSASFLNTLQNRKMNACVHCDDWTQK